MNPLEPAPSPFDLRWRLFGIAVRVHPSFWGMNLLWAVLVTQGGRGTNLLLFIFLWVVCAFVSVLVHEMGHVLMGMTFREPGNILLYSFGGYALGLYDRLPPWQRILVSFAGPGIQLLFLALIVLVDNKPWNLRIMEYLGLNSLRTPWCVLDAVDPLYFTRGWYTQVGVTVTYLLVIMNLFWAIFNLIPVFPLDGGMIVRSFCQMFMPRNYVRFSLGLSFLVAGLIAVYSLIVMMRPEGDLPYLGWPVFNLIMFGLLAFQNFAALRAEEMNQRRWQYYED